MRSVRWRKHSPEEMVLYLVYHGKFTTVQDFETFVIRYGHMTTQMGYEAEQSTQIAPKTSTKGARSRM